MIQAYVEHGQTETAVFEFFVRKCPARRGFLVAAGLEQVLSYLESLRFSPEELEWLASTGQFGRRLLDYLSTLRFEGDVDVMPEGTVLFANEPILRVVSTIAASAIARDPRDQPAAFSIVDRRQSGQNGAGGARKTPCRLRVASRPRR
jgi:nicotinic acid phosphoribosyltransferase